MSLSGTHQKENPYWEKGSRWGLVFPLCSFLYILDMTGFSLQVIEGKMYKKATFYTYANPQKK